MTTVIDSIPGNKGDILVSKIRKKRRGKEGRRKSSSRIDSPRMNSIFQDSKFRNTSKTSSTPIACVVNAIEKGPRPA
jgi:hypothetical protein